MSQHFDFYEASLAGLFRIERKPITDSRGFFSRYYCAGEFKELGLEQAIAQMNSTLTHRKGTIRGMHFQYSPHTETKVITCIQGEVFDVAIDLRKGSPTFLKWHAEILSAETQTSFYIPEGFAHGFQTLKDDSQLLYFHSVPYNAEAEGAVNAFDPKIEIDWPLGATEISERDQSHPHLDGHFEGL